MIKTFFVSIVLVLLSSSTFADTYKWVDEKGTLHFGDRPPRESAYNVEHKEVDSATLGRKRYYSEKNRKKMRRSEPGERILILEETAKLFTKKVIEIKLELVNESNRSLEFYIEYDYEGKENAGYLGMKALTADRSKNYLIHQKPWVPIKPGSNRAYFTLKNWGQSRARMVETAWLRLYIYDSDNKRDKHIYRRFIPFKKNWLIRG